MNITVNQISPEVLRTESEIIASWTEADEEPLVSVGCITFNHEKYIEDAIVGFLRQETTFPIEILIHDDASTDSTPQVIRKYQSKYPKLIKPLIQKENQFSRGVITQSFNVKRALGKYYALCEGDDYWVSCTHLQDAVQSFKVNESISIYGAASFIKKGDSVSRHIPADSRFSLGTYIDKAPFIATCSIVTRTKIWKEIIDVPVYGGRYFAGDTRLKLISLTKGDMCVNQTPAVVYRKGTEGSWSNRKIDDRVVIRELLDNVAITREVGVINDYKAYDALYARIEKETLTKGLALASHKGFFSWLGFVLTHLKVCSPKMIRATIFQCPMVKWIRN